MQLFKTLLLIASFGFATAASAQWQWTDKDGNKVFSDRAPPSDVPDRNILKRPGGNRAVAPPPPVAAPANDAAPVLPKIKGTDPALEEKKRLAEEAEAAKRKAEEDKIAAVRAENCTRAKQAKASLDSGMRIARTNAQGEREILDDAARAAETKRLQDIVTADCR